MSGCLYILTGASGCGKTTLLNGVCTDPMDPQLRAVKAPKYSERERRPGDETDDITHDPHIEIGEYDVAYVINNTKYGIKTGEIRKLLDKGLNPFIVLSDFRVVRRLKNIFPGQAQAIYVSSAIDAERLRRIQAERLGFRPNGDQKSCLAGHFDRVSAAARLGWWNRVSDCMSALYEDWKEYAEDSQSTEIRAQRIRAFHIRYIEYLQLFDHVVLNYSEDNPDEMVAQACNIINAGPQFAQFGKKTHPPLFIVAAASGAGKGTLMEMLGLIGSDMIAITTKVAGRDRKDKDKRDGMLALGKNASLPPEFDLRWRFHKGDDSDFAGVEYGVSSSEIQHHIDEGRAQILVSNMQQFHQFRERWPNNATFVYLHRLSSAHEIRQYQYDNNSDAQEADIRINEIAKVHSHYIEHIAEFDHVLLNTSFPEDLYDQMFQLVEYHADQHERMSM